MILIIIAWDVRWLGQFSWRMQDRQPKLFLNLILSEYDRHPKPSTYLFLSIVSTTSTLFASFLINFYCCLSKIVLYKRHSSLNHRFKIPDKRIFLPYSWCKQTAVKKFPSHRRKTRSFHLSSVVRTLIYCFSLTHVFYLLIIFSCCNFLLKHALLKSFFLSTKNYVRALFFLQVILWVMNYVFCFRYTLEALS